MEEKIKFHLFQKLQIPPHARILVAVSGGMDSVTLLHLLKNLGFTIAAAHVNFQLRGDESNSDEAFVKELAAHYGIPFYSKCFDTKSFADKEGISTQMAARNLRYKWFEQQATQHQWDFIATAHHLDDQIETFFINLLRGTGISGLKGIPAKSGLIIRPLLPFYRIEIEEYVKTRRLDYREDSSNSKTDYLRNRIRHQLLPLLDELQPAFRKVMAGNLDHLMAAESFFRQAIAEQTKGMLTEGDSGLQITFPQILQSKHPELLLHEILQEYGFSTTQSKQIFLALDSQPGKIFFSDSHRLIKDREFLLLQALSELDGDESCMVIEENITEVFCPLHLQFQTLARDIDFQPSPDPDKAFLDLAALQFPLKVRKWKHGDRFKPLGMKGQMKLSDFFVANKFSIAEKERTWLLTDNADNIIWIIGHRIADPNRIRPATKTVYSIAYIH
jgi:tRNA(Ile)-lysidine synthase